MVILIIKEEDVVEGLIIIKHKEGFIIKRELKIT